MLRIITILNSLFVIKILHCHARRLVSIALDSKSILAASKGDEDALQLILEHYDHRITAMATEEYIDEHGVTRKRINEETKVTLQSELVMSLMKFSLEKANKP